MAMYESEYTKFMREWLNAHPQEATEQQKGRALWWDKPAQTKEEQQRVRDARVPQKAYYYDAN
jgi:hypothetical protein